MEIFPRLLFPALKETLMDQRVVVLTGMRRTGKTTSLRWLLDQVSSPNKLYLDLEHLDQRAVFQESNYDLILDYLRHRGLDTRQPMTVVLDEIQYVRNLPSVVKYLHDTQPIKFFLAGCGAHDFQRTLSESLSGRKVSYEIEPLTFGEFLDFCAVLYRRRPTLAATIFDPHEYDRLKGWYNDYLLFGGLPEVVLEKRPGVRQDLLNTILSAYINEDVRILVDFQKIDKLHQLMRLLALGIGRKLDNSWLASVVGLSRPTVMQYLDFLEKTGVIRRVSALVGRDRPAASARKLYFCDNGIVGTLANVGEAVLFENAVQNQLRSYGRLSYLNRAAEHPSDFLLEQENSLGIALAVEYHPTLSDHRRLKRLSARHGVTESWLVGRYPTASFRKFLWGGLIF